MDIVEQLDKFHAWHLRNYLRINRLSADPGREAFEFAYMVLWILRHWGFVEQFADRAISVQDAEYIDQHIRRGESSLRALYLKVLDDLVSDRGTSWIVEHEILSGLVLYTEAWDPDEHFVKTVFFMAEAMRAMTRSSYLAPADQSVRSRIGQIFVRWSQEACQLFDETISSKYGTNQDVLDSLDVE
jgi:hypothetical protein